jgi:hypothetical protein
MEHEYDVGYEFLVFKTVIDELPASQIKLVAEDYKQCVVWDLWAGTVSLNIEVQNILIFLDFLDSQIVPVGISPAEQEFYRRTAERLVREGFLPRHVMQQFKKPKSVGAPLIAGEEKLILCFAA